MIVERVLHMLFDVLIGGYAAWILFVFFLWGMDRFFYCSEHAKRSLKSRKRRKVKLWNTAVAKPIKHVDAYKNFDDIPPVGVGKWYTDGVSDDGQYLEGEEIDGYHWWS